MVMNMENMDEQFFAERLASLRMKKNVSAFFDERNADPTKRRLISAALEALTDKQLDIVYAVVMGLSERS